VIPPPPADIAQVDYEATKAPPHDPATVGYFDYINLVAKAKIAGTVTIEQVNEALRANGLSVHGQLAARVDLIPQVLRSLGL
jgi:hypothetical protein